MTQLYRITRAGSQFTRLEWPDGTPVRGPRFELDPRTNQFVPRKNGLGQSYLKVTYGAVGYTKSNKEGEAVDFVDKDRMQHLFRNEIRLSPQGARALAHMGLVLVVGGAVVKPVVEENKDEEQDTQDEEQEHEEDGKTPPKGVTIPEDWRKLNPSAMAKLACALLEKPYEPMKKAQSMAIIEEFTGDGSDATNSG